MFSIFFIWNRKNDLNVSVKQWQWYSHPFCMIICMIILYCICQYILQIGFHKAGHFSFSIIKWYTARSYWSMSMLYENAKHARVSYFLLLASTLSICIFKKDAMRRASLYFSRVLPIPTCFISRYIKHAHTSLIEGKIEARAYFITK